VDDIFVEFGNGDLELADNVFALGSRKGDLDGNKIRIGMLLIHDQWTMRRHGWGTESLRMDGLL